MTPERLREIRRFIEPDLEHSLITSRIIVELLAEIERLTHGLGMLKREYDEVVILHDIEEKKLATENGRLSTYVLQLQDLCSAKQDRITMFLEAIDAMKQ